MHARPTDRKVPGGQRTQTLPLGEASVPERHGSHADCAAFGTLPSVQASHSVPSALVVPCGHSVQSAPVTQPPSAAGISQVWPAGHAKSGAHPTCGLNPATQTQPEGVRSSTSSAQQVPLAGAVIVSTPQDIALLDARKGLNMFRKVDVPVLGIIENMSYFRCPNCGHESHIFSHGGAHEEADRLGGEFLGEIPIDPRVVVGGDEGVPIVARDPEAPAAKAKR